MRQPLFRVARIAIVSVAAIAVTSSSPRLQSRTGVDAQVVALVGSISQARLQQLLPVLVAFGTRDARSATSDPRRGNRAAAQWIHDELLRSGSRLQVSFDVHQVAKGEVTGFPEGAEIRNVVAVMPGRSSRRIYVTGHYDSYHRGGGPDADAPGANDNGSGTVLVMELARAFAASRIDFDATLVFMASSAEEQGLVGARLHAARVQKTDTAIQADFNNDIVGGVMDEDRNADRTSVRVFSAGPEDSPSRALAVFTRRVAARYVPSHRVRLIAHGDRQGRSGDHEAFNRAGVAAIGFRESRENLSRQHNEKDTLDTISFPYLTQNARVNAAAVAELALAPPPPTLNGISTSVSDVRTATLRWKAVANAIGYRVYWRDAWGPDWQHDVQVGNATQHVVPHVTVDDSVFGVAAIGPGGHESTIAVYATK